MASRDRPSILIVGGAGAFGARIAELLARGGEMDLVLAGRRLAPLEAQAASLAATSGRSVRAVTLDADRATANDIAGLGVEVLINASGPFQAGSYALARAAIGASAHYIDLADARDFVVGFRGELDEAARAAGVLAVSGASSVPGISSAVVTHYREAFAGVTTIDIAISPGNAFDPGVATVSSVLGGVGQPIRMFEDEAWRTVYGWQGLRRVGFGRAGRRWLGYVDVPDLEILAAYLPGVRTVRFQAGLEVSLFHLGLWAASWLVRAGLVRSLAPLAPALLAIKRRASRLGSDRGGMIVALRGIGRDARPTSLTWLLEAGSGHGPYVPALTAVALARQLASGAEKRHGAFPCHAMVRLADILAEAEGLDIVCTAHEKALPRRRA